jgi:hypothetical protein
VAVDLSSQEPNKMMIVLRFVHVVCGVLWVGAVVFVAAFLLPSLRAVGPAAGPVMAQLAQVRKYPVYMMALATLVLLSGISLLMSEPSGWMQSPTGRTFSAGATIAIIGAIFGMVTTSPAAKKMGAIAAAAGKRGGPPSPEEAAELQRLQNKVAASTRLVAVLLVIATAAMAVARYV